jgi:hypothetical protein
VQGRGAREAQDVAHDPLQPAHLGAGHGDPPHGPGRDPATGPFQVLLEKLELDVDGAKRVPHLVRQRGGQPAEGRHLLGLPDVPLDPFQVRDLAEDQQDPGPGLSGRTGGSGQVAGRQP